MSAIHQIVKIEARVQWVTFSSPTSKRIIGVCDMLNLSLEADSQEELRSLIPETINLLMVDLLQDNELDQFLREKGWRATNIPVQNDSDVQFNVPFELIAAGGNGDSARRPC